MGVVDVLDPGAWARAGLVGLFTFPMEHLLVPQSVLSAFFGQVHFLGGGMVKFRIPIHPSVCSCRTHKRRGAGQSLPFIPARS